ncbi:MAG: hypothetical protein R3F13_10850 [Prosthecobacter sp.]
MSGGLLLVIATSILWMLLCMRFWWVIDQDNVWQRRLIAIAAGLGGGMIYMIGTMMLEMLKECPPEPRDASEIRVMPKKKAP